MPVAQEQGWQIAVEADEKRQPQEGVAPKDLDPASGIRAAVAQDRVANLIGYLRGELFGAIRLAILHR